MSSGLNGMIRNINNLKKTGLAGLSTAALFVKAESQQICPVDTANLIGGAYINPVQEVGQKATVEIGYQASYAPFVHEAPDKTRWQKPTAENKFLEKALVRNEKTILHLIGEGVTGGFHK